MLLKLSVGLQMKKDKKIQKITVFQQSGSAEAKLVGIRKYGEGRFFLEIVDIDLPLPPVIEDGGEYLPESIRADMVLDFLRHPDLSQDLAAVCAKSGIPVVASGKKFRIENVFTPPT